MEEQPKSSKPTLREHLQRLIRERYQHRSKLHRNPAKRPEVRMAASNRACDADQMPPGKVVPGSAVANAIADWEFPMCLSPLKISDVGWVACRECWQCRERKVDDWVGRNIAESKTAKAAHVVTLTYGEDPRIGGIDHIRAALLTYSDVQKYLKRLRGDGYPVRYFVVGEYGSVKGRAHWHIVLYWQAAVPEHRHRENFMQKHWPHGWSYWDEVSPSAIRYACKYLQKVSRTMHGKASARCPRKAATG